MNRAKFLQPTLTCYEGSYDGVWVVQYENELYRVVLCEEFFSCHLLFGDFDESVEIKDKPLMLSIQAVIATELFVLSEKREKWEQGKKAHIKQLRINGDL